MKTKQLILLVAFLGMFVQVKAQSSTSPSLEETMSFIKMKTIGRTLVLTKQTGDGIGNYIAVNTTDIVLSGHTLTYYFKNSPKIIVDLEHVKGIELYDNDEDVMLLSDVNEFVNWDGKEFSFYRSYIKTDASKVLKAYKHLFDLLGIKLIGDAF
jgi:hypothetical protein